MRWTKFILEVKNNKFSHTSLACKMIDENTIRKKVTVPVKVYSDCNKMSKRNTFGGSYPEKEIKV